FLVDEDGCFFVVVFYSHTDHLSSLYSSITKLSSRSCNNSTRTSLSVNGSLPPMRRMVSRQAVATLQGCRSPRWASSRITLIRPAASTSKSISFILYDLLDFEVLYFPDTPPIPAYLLDTQLSTPPILR